MSRRRPADPRAGAPMKVAMVSEHASPLAVLGGEDAGGQNVHVAALSAALARRGAEVVVHTRRDDPDLPSRVEAAPGVTIEHVDAGPAKPIPKDDLLPHMDEFAHLLRQSFRADPPGVVHAHFWMSGRAALAAARPLGIPVAQTFHALGVVKRRHQGVKDTSPPSRLREEATLAREADRIVATCSDEVFELVRMGADLRRVAVVPCGVDLGMFRPDGPAAPRSSGVARLLVVSRLVERKGIGDMVAAMARLPGVELLVAGGPPAAELAGEPEARRLTAMAERVGVAGQVRLLGRVGRCDLPALYRSADLVVNVPWYEPFGIVPLEAMACGVPMVASAVGGLVDSVVDGVTGVHVPPRRPGLLAEAVAGLLADPERRATLGATGARRARRRYGWDRIAGSTLEVYAGLQASAADHRDRRHPPGATDHRDHRPSPGAVGYSEQLPSGAVNYPEQLPSGAVESREQVGSPGAVDDLEQVPWPSATLPLRGASQPGVEFARARAPQSGRWPR
jgi:D-inositol-3-phosphate glycosyltransferase